MDFLDNVLNWFFIIKIGIDILFKYIIVWFVKDKELCEYYYKKVWVYLWWIVERWNWFYLILI